jgi:hypothetical protein
MRSMFAAALCLLACAPGAGTEAVSTGAKAGGMAPATSAVSSSAAAPAALPACTPDPRAEKSSASLAARQKGLAALAAGDPAAAEHALRTALRARPSDLAAFTLHSVAAFEKEALRKELSKSTSKIAPAVAAKVAPPHKTLAKVDKIRPAGAVTIKRVSEERHDDRTGNLLDRVGIKSPFAAVDGPDPMVPFPLEMGELTAGGGTFHPDHTIVKYPPGIVMISGQGGGLRAVDLVASVAEGFQSVLGGKSASPSAPGAARIDTSRIHAGVEHAQVIGPLLVAQLSHDGDGGAAKPDGFLLGFDLSTGKVAWVSDAGVANGSHFYATGSVIVTSFGTATWADRNRAKNSYTTLQETDAKLNVIELGTGRLVASAQLGARALNVWGKGTRIYAWGPEKVEIFELSDAPAPAKAELGALTPVEAKRPVAPAGDAACWLRNATVALDHRDGAAVLRVASVWPEDGALAKALVAAGEFLNERAAGRSGVDLTEVEITFSSPAPGPKTWQKAPRKAVEPRRLTPVKEADLMAPPPAKKPATPAERVEQPEYGFPRSKTGGYPPAFGLTYLRWANERDKDAFLAFSGRFVAMVRDGAAVKVIDFMPWGIGLAGAQPADPDYAPLEYLSMFDDAILLVTSPPQYEAKTSTAVLASVDPASLAVLWQSPAGVLSVPPLVFSEHVVTVLNRPGAAELVAFRRHDGEIVSRAALPDPGLRLEWDRRGAVAVTLPNERRFYTFR